jgi:polar amino acid transport system substrate-binding protein
MMFNKRRASLALITSVVVGATLMASAQGVRTLRFVSPERPPFTDVPGKPRFALDLVEAALKRVNVSATTTIVPPAEFGKALLSGPFDGTAEAWRDSERERVLLFSDPYLENRLVLVGRSGSDVTATSLATLKGKKVALVTGYAYGDGFENAGPTWVRSKGEQDSLSLLLNGAIDYFLMDELVVQYLVQSYPEESRTRLAIGTIPLHTRPVYLTLSRALPDGAAIISRFNSQLKVMISDRTYHQLLRVDWIRADVDGDGQVEYVASSDQVGKTEPRRAYDLFSQTVATQAKQPLKTERYFFDGAVYNGWSSVPDKYKVDHLDRPDHTHPTARVMTFTWK